MSRIIIKDLPKDMKTSKEETKEVLGGFKQDIKMFPYKYLHYNPCARMQQGRVQLDEDYNESMIKVALNPFG